MKERERERDEHRIKFKCDAKMPGYHFKDVARRRLESLPDRESTISFV